MYMLSSEDDMSKIFDADNKFFSTLSKVFDMMVLNFLWLVTLVAFIGPACTGLYYAVVKNIRRSRDYTARTFFHSFKSNFKPAAILGILQIIFGFGLYTCYQFAISMNPDAYLGQVYYWVVIVTALLYLMISVYIYPVLSRFDMKVFPIIRMSMYMAIRHIPTTIVGVAGLVVAFYCLKYIQLSPLFLFAPVLYVFVLSFPMEGVLRKYMPKKEDAGENEQEAWYYE